MGITTSISIIYVNVKDVEIFNVEGLKEPKIRKLKSLNPTNLSISAISNNTIILWWNGIVNFMGDENEEDLTLLEEQIYEIFPKSLVLTMLISDVVNLRYFALVENRKVLRKKGTCEGKIIEDRGVLLSIEKSILEILDKSPVNNYREQFRKHRTQDSEDQISKMVYHYFSKEQFFTNYDYKNGSLDEYIIDYFFSIMTGEDILDYYNNTDFAVFPLRKWKNDKHLSLGDYIMKGVAALLQTDKVRTSKSKWTE